MTARLWEREAGQLQVISFEQGIHVIWEFSIRILSYLSSVIISIAMIPFDSSWSDLEASLRLADSSDIALLPLRLVLIKNFNTTDVRDFFP